MNFLRRILCCKKIYSSGVYRLQLSDNKYYIGKSYEIERRIWCHLHNNGSAWTRKYDVIERLPLLTDCKDSKLWELEETLENMNQFGIDNVRGSMFSKIILSNEEKINAGKLYCEMYDLCRKCGSGNHFITYCKNDKMEPWVQKFGGNLIESKRRCHKCFKDINNLPSYYRYCNECYT